MTRKTSAVVSVEVAAGGSGTDHERCHGRDRGGGKIVQISEGCGYGGIKNIQRSRVNG